MDFSADDRVTVRHNMIGNHRHAHQRLGSGYAVASFGLGNRAQRAPHIWPMRFWAGSRVVRLWERVGGGFGADVVLTFCNA